MTDRTNGHNLAENPSKGIHVENIRRLGIIAGGGQFPKLIAEEAKTRGIYVAVCGFLNNTDETLKNHCDAFRILALGQLSKLLNFYKENNVTHVCFAGTINKPKALDIRPDLRAAKLIFSLKTKGDDVLLRAILGEFEKEGFQCVSASVFLPNLKAPQGVLTSRKIPENILSDINYGFPIAKSMGSYDIGQCLVVKNGMVVAVECLEGTDATLLRAHELAGKDCIAIKVVKPNQDERIDLPSIGLKTIENLVKYQYAGLAVEADKTLFFDREEAIKLADKHKIHIIAL